jgi:hypothetical protein
MTSENLLATITLNLFAAYVYISSIKIAILKEVKGRI